jgi:hypothetical protein
MSGTIPSLHHVISLRAYCQLQFYFKTSSAEILPEIENYLQVTLSHGFCSFLIQIRIYDDEIGKAFRTHGSDVNAKFREEYLKERD